MPAFIPLPGNASLAPGTTLYLTGIGGLTNPAVVVPTSSAIILDSAQLAVFDWGTGTLANSFDLTLDGTTRYLTFAAPSGLDADDQWAHVAFANVQLSTVPEPATTLLLGVGLVAFGLQRFRRRA